MVGLVTPLESLQIRTIFVLQRHVNTLVEIAVEFLLKNYFYEILAIIKAPSDGFFKLAIKLASHFGS